MEKDTRQRLWSGGWLGEGFKPSSTKLNHRTGSALLRRPRSQDLREAEAREESCAYLQDQWREELHEDPEAGAGLAGSSCRQRQAWQSGKG